MNWLLQFLFVLSIFGFSSCQEEDDYLYDPDVRVSYKFHSVPMNWLNAKLTCFEEGGKLAMPINLAEANAIIAIFQEFITTDQVLIFLDSHDLFEFNEFITQDYYLQYFFHTWNTGQPSEVDGHCLAMRNNTRLHNYRCNDTLPFICQRSEVTKVEDRTVYPADPRYIYDSSSRKFLKLHMHMRTWPEARATCNAEGGRLAVIESKSQENFMVTMFSDPSNLWPGSEKFAFIGIHDMYRSRLFYTVSDQNLNDVGYVHWALGEPNNVNQRCGAMTTKGGISDQMCSTKAQFFCERKYTIVA